MQDFNPKKWNPSREGFIFCMVVFDLKYKFSYKNKESPWNKDFLCINECWWLWSRWQDLNLRPLRPERSALPNWATPRYLILYANLLLCAFFYFTRALRLLLRCPKKLRNFIIPCFFDRGAFSLSLHLHLAAVKLKATKLSHTSLFNYALKSTNISDLLII